MEVLQNKVNEILEASDNVEPGSEEHERLINSAATLVKADAEITKAENEVENRKAESKKAITVAGITAAGLLVGGIIKEVLKFITNLRVTRCEDDYQVINSRAYDNK
jgi:hypothetical protein